MIGIISAMDVEMELLIKELKNLQINSQGLMTYYSGTLYHKNVVLSVCGPGKINAALCAQGMIFHYSPRIIINLGVAGGLQKDLSIGDIVIGSNCVQYDFDTTALGDPLGLLPLINKVHIPCDPSLISSMKHSLSLMKNISYQIGTIATGDLFVSSKEKKQFLVENFNALCCEMEGGAIAHACYLYQIPFVVVRSISDSADAHSLIDYPTFKRQAANVSAKLISIFLKESFD